MTTIRSMMTASQPGLPRRQFLGWGTSLLGMGALGAAVPPGPPEGSTGDDILDERADDGVEPSACTIALWSTSRRAATSQVVVTACNPCNCPPRGQTNFTLRQRMTTNFDVLGFCDELGAIGFPTTARIDWDIRKKEVRLNGPCQTPIGSFAGKFVVRDVIGNPLISGKVVGTLGYDPCQPENSCCYFPRIIGTLSGKGERGTAFGDCIVRWAFCGIEPFPTGNPCQIEVFDTCIHGIMRCPC